jgi:hypothetical protein
MGPVDSLKNDAAKLFASFYALYSGLVLLATLGVMLAPVIHHVLHVFHADLDEEEKKAKAKAAKKDSGK